MTINSKIVIRNKKSDDAWDDYNWAIDPELTQLDAAPMLSITFHQYLAEHADDLRNPPPNRRQFAVDTLESKHIGNCSYYNINETKSEAELGIMIGNRKYWNSGYGTDAVSALLDYIFGQTNLNRVYLKTLEWNTRAQKCFQKCGFIPYGHIVKDGYNFHLMEIYRSEWQKQRTNT